MTHKFIATLALTALFAFPALAMSLQEGRASGAIGEKMDGYVAVVVQSPAASALASEVNAKRKAEYARISKENGHPADIVAKLAAEQIINGLPAGAKYQDASGNWKSK